MRSRKSSGRPPPPPRPSSRRGGMMVGPRPPSFGSSTATGLCNITIGLMRSYARRVGLHDEILRGPGDAVLVWTMVYDGDNSAEIVVRWRRGNCPLEGRRLPRIHVRLLALEHAPEQIDDEDHLGCDRNECRNRHELLQWNQVVQVCQLRQLRIPPGVSCHAQVVH